MALDPKHWKQISAYLAGDLRDDERIVFEQWLENSPAHQEIFREAKRIWESSNARLSARDETDVLWLRLRSRIERDRTKSGVHIFFDQHRTWLKAVAGITLFAGAVYFAFRLRSSDTILQAENTVAMVYLPDSTKVWLNLHSTLTYSKDYGKRSRSATLEGEGYFEVMRDETIPFVVRAGDAWITVLGTSFNLKEDSSVMTLTVSSGSVQVDAGGNGQQVNAKEQITLEKDGNLKKERYTGSSVAGWRKRNNPVYDRETRSPLQFLAHHYTWRKNSFNQSVIEGHLRNTATLASYKNVVLKVTSSKPNGTLTVTQLTIRETVGAGKVMPYRRRLLDLLTANRVVNIEIVSAETVDPTL